MKKPLFFILFIAATALLSGCSTPSCPAPAPAPAPEAPPEAAPAPMEVPPVETPVLSTLPQEMKQLAADIQLSGGLAALGTAESRSLDLALNMAKKNGRIELSRALDTRFEALEKAFSEETGIPFDSLFLSGFNHTARLIKQQIAGSVAHTLKYETTGDTFTAYAVMVLDPKVIADHLAKEKELFSRLQTTKAFREFNKEINAYQTFKAAQP